MRPFLIILLYLLYSGILIIEYCVGIIVDNFLKFVETSTHDRHFSQLIFIFLFFIALPYGYTAVYLQ